MSKDQSEQDERKAFEEWCMRRWGGDRGALTTVSDRSSRDFGEYLNSHVEFAWQAWLESSTR